MRCTFDTKQGKPCRNNVRDGETLCSRHLHPRTKLIDPKDKSNPGVFKRQSNLVPTMPKHLQEMVAKCGSQKELAEQYAPAILAGLVELATTCENPAVKASVGMYLTDRIYGKSIQPILMEANVNVNTGIMILPSKHIIDVVNLDPIDIVAEDGYGVK